MKVYLNSEGRKIFNVPYPAPLWEVLKIAPAPYDKEKNILTVKTPIGICFICEDWLEKEVV